MRAAHQRKNIDALAAAWAGRGSLSDNGWSVRPADHRRDRLLAGMPARYAAT